MDPLMVGAGGFLVSEMLRKEATRVARVAEPPRPPSMSGLVERMIESKNVGAPIAANAVPFNPIDRSGGVKEITLSLASSGFINRFLGRAWGIVYLKDGSNPAGRLDLEFAGGGRITNVPPGTVLPVQFEQCEFHRGSRSGTVGDARLVVLTTPAAQYLPPLEVPGPIAPVYLLGASGAFSDLQGENAAPPTRQLNYTSQTANFTVGLTVTGGTSGATGVIASQDDNGTTGTLYLSSVTGAFQAETITDSGGGSATGAADSALAGADVPTSFDVTGFKKVSVMVDTASASGNATSFDLVPWFFDSNASLWHNQALSTISIPDSSPSAGQYRSLVMEMTGLSGRLFLQISNLLASARTGLSFKVIGVE